MKNDQTFKFVAVILVIGVLVAFASPTHSAPAAPQKTDAISSIKSTFS